MPVSAPCDEIQMGSAESPYLDEEENKHQLLRDAHCIAFVIRLFENFPLWPFPRWKAPVGFTLYAPVSLEMSPTGFVGEGMRYGLSY